MTHANSRYATLDEWIAREAIPFAVDAPATFDAAVAKVVASLGDRVELPGFGEALHGGEDILILRNRKRGGGEAGCSRGSGHQPRHRPDKRGGGQLDLPLWEKSGAGEFL
jgi:hypothetical protein